MIPGQPGVEAVCLDQAAQYLVALGDEVYPPRSALALWIRRDRFLEDGDRPANLFPSRVPFRAPEKQPVEQTDLLPGGGTPALETVFLSLRSSFTISSTWVQIAWSHSSSILTVPEETCGRSRRGVRFSPPEGCSAASAAGPVRSARAKQKNHGADFTNRFLSFGCR